jgi:hypothetical protein
MFLYIGISVAILLTFYFNRNKCKESKDEFSVLFGHYNPERKCLSSKELKNNLLDKSLSFLDSKNPYITHRMFKTLEFFVAEQIIGTSIIIMNCDDSYNRIKNIVKIHNLIDEYKSIYHNGDEILISLLCKIYQNMLKIETDIYELYKVINGILKTTTHKQLNKSVIVLYKNFYWHSTLKYKGKSLFSFIRGNLNKK